MDEDDQGPSSQWLLNINVTSKCYEFFQFFIDTASLLKSAGPPQFKFDKLHNCKSKYLKQQILNGEMLEVFLYRFIYYSKTLILLYYLFN